VPQARAAFRYPNYRYYMTARFLTPLASEMQAVAMAIVVALWARLFPALRRVEDLGGATR
jgi:hypothetical protein